MKPICRYVQAVHTMLFVPGSHTVIVTNHRRETVDDIMELLEGFPGVTVHPQDPTVIKYCNSRIRVATINDMHDAHRFAGSEINLLCIDAFMPYEVEMYMKYRIRNLKLPNGDIYKGISVEME